MERDKMSNELAVRSDSFLSPVVDVTTALRRYQDVKDFIGGVLREGVDFGKVPGSSKPTLLKPGAEKMTALFGFDVRMLLEEKTEDWLGEDHKGEPFFYYRYKAQLWRSDRLVAEGEGSCNSWEKKYRYRQAKRICPSCGQPAIITGKAEYGGGWLCFRKKGGCGTKFNDNDPTITDQQMGQMKNPDPAEQVNTYQKMAQKRALVAPVLIATNTSDYFTQDIEDFNIVDVQVTDYDPAQDLKDLGVDVEVTKIDIPAPDALDVYQAVVDAKLSENTFGAKNALNKCKTGYDTNEKAIAWMRIYRGHRDSGLASNDAAAFANGGNMP
jgi:hypothetical protein